MNKTVLIALALIVLVGGGFYVSKQMGSSPGTPSSSETTQSASTKGSLRSLLSLGQNVTCAMTNPDGSKGTVFVASDRVRGDFETKSDKGTMMTHMIQSGGFMYLWQEGEAQGMKMKFDETTTADAQDTQATAQGNVDLDSEVDLSCTPWGVDQSKFTPPASVTFTELSSMLQTDDAKKAMQAACDQITDPEAKAACLTNFGGN
jgi:hypothetical protein